MSKAELFTELANLVDIDPFALIGISLSADEKRISKRYRQVAKLLHPDALAGGQALTGMDERVAAQVIARIVNPSYQKLKHEKSRQETLATIRLRARRLVRTEKLLPTFYSAKGLAEADDESVDIFYEQALSKLAEGQFQSLDDLRSHALEISQLNLIFLSRRLENLTLWPKRAGLMSAAVTPTAVAAAAAHTELATETAEKPAINYAQKHTTRAKTYLAQQNYEAAVQELREALKISPQNPELHSMIGQVYYKQKLSGMAKTHFRQALKLKPDHKMALKYSTLLGILNESITRSFIPQAAEEAPKKPWLGRLLNR
ncbi:MAG: tetratricopeptide repeat protein [Phormidesmis sp.]